MCVREEARRVSPGPPKVQVRRDQKSTQLGTRWQVQVAGAGQQAALASKRQLNN